MARSAMALVARWATRGARLAGHPRTPQLVGSVEAPVRRHASAPSASWISCKKCVKKTAFHHCVPSK